MKKILFALPVLLILLVPSFLSAQTGLVPCSGAPGDECGTCELVALVNGIVDWLIAILMVVFAIIVVWAGFGLVTSGGNPEAKSDAKKKMTNAIIGLIIVLSAWLMIDTVMRVVLQGGNGEMNGVLWSTVQCSSQATTVAPSPANAPGVDIVTGPVASTSLPYLYARCGGDNNQQIATPPMLLCDSGAPSPVSEVQPGGPWTWSCVGTNEAYCVAYPIGSGGAGGWGGSGVEVGPAPGVTPAGCGTAAGVNTEEFPSNNLCVADNQMGILDNEGADGTYNWNCFDSKYTSNEICSAPRVVYNECNPAMNNGDSVNRPHQSLLCSGGDPVWVNPSDSNANAPTGTGKKWVWRCTGASGPDANCSANYKFIEAFCGDADGGPAVESQPTTDLCDPGDLRWTDSTGGDGTYNWECSGGFAVKEVKQCSVGRRFDNTCGENFGSCTAGPGTAENVNPRSINWDCPGKNGGTGENNCRAR